MKEIGGYLELEHLSGSHYHEGALKINCARNAIVLNAKLSKAKRVFLPYYLCSSVKNALADHGIECRFYRVDENFHPMIDNKTEKNDMLLIVNFFGQLDLESAAHAFRDRAMILFDNTQAFFEKPPENTDAVYSCRKYFGVPDGAYLYTKNIVNAPSLKPAAVSSLCGHLLGRLEDTASAHLEEHRKNDQSFAGKPIEGMSLFTENILRAVDYASVSEKRRQNFSRLHDSLKNMNPLNLRFPVGPFAYPFYTENGIELRKKLAQKKIYVPTLWPDVLKMPDNSTEKRYAENILPLPCDQRYGSDDMDLILEALEACI